MVSSKVVWNEYVSIGERLRALPQVRWVLDEYKYLRIRVVLFWVEVLRFVDFISRHMDVPSSNYSPVWLANKIEDAFALFADESCAIVEGVNVLANHMIQKTDESIDGQLSLECYRALMTDLHYLSLNDLPYCDFSRVGGLHFPLAGLLRFIPSFNLKY